MSALIKAYQRLLVERPILSQSVQTAILMATGDLISQKLVEERKVIDWRRTARFSSIGFVLVGPVLRQWYGFLNRRITLGSPSIVTIKKVACDQLFFAPGLIAVLLTTFNAVEGLSIENNKEKLKKDYPVVLKNNYLLWPWVQMVNFWIVPLNYQVLTVQLVCIFWNTYLSWKAHADVDIKLQQS